MSTLRKISLVNGALWRVGTRTEADPPPNMPLSVKPDSDNRFPPLCCQASICRRLASASCLAYSIGMSFPLKAFRIGRTSGGRYIATAKEVEDS
jgi:hypothetical protein